MATAGSLQTDLLPLLALRLRLRFESAPPTALHAAEMWRGAIKNGLEHRFPDILTALSGPERIVGSTGGERSTNTLTPGYVLRVEEDDAKLDDHGGAQTVYLTFFGRASIHALPVLYSLLEQAHKGVGQGKLRYRFVGLESFRPNSGWAELALPTNPQGFDSHLWLHPGAATLGAEFDRRVRFAVVLTSRARLLVRGKLVVEPPELGLLIGSLVDRSNRLGVVWGGGPVLSEASTSEVRIAAKSARKLRAVEAPLRKRRISSGRQKTSYSSDGLGGMLVYDMPAVAFRAVLPLLAFGQWLHLGQQTTAGLGHYQLLTPVT
jgi:hypothetical protein